MRKACIFFGLSKELGSVLPKLSSIFYFFLLLSVPLLAQNPKELFELSQKAQEKGDFISAEKYLLAVLQQKDNIEAKNIVAVYNELGIINKSLGKYNKAIGYYSKGENIVLENRKALQYKLSYIYSNMGNIYRYMGDYKKALEYLQQSINSQYLNGLSEKKKQISLSYVFNNMGLIYFSQKYYQKAILYFNKSIKIRKEYRLESLDDSYNNYANCLRELNEHTQAEINYQKCIDIRIKESGEKNYKLASVYKSYGTLKIKSGDKIKGLALYNKGLSIYLKGYGKRHPHTAEMLEFLGNYYLEQKNYQKALAYYQQSLIANSANFNNTNIFKNPKPENVLSQIQLLQSLEKKATALSFFHNNQTDTITKKTIMNSCIETLELAVNTLKKLRQGYIFVESKLYITQNEKGIYMQGIDNSLQAYELTGDKKYLQKAYQFSRASKAAVLEDEINRNETFANVLPDSLNKLKTEIEQNIAAREKLIFDEHENVKPDQLKITRWQSELFKLNRKYEQLLKTIESGYPDYSIILSKKKIPTLVEIQKELLPNETLVEYSYSLTDRQGKLYAFVIDKNDIKYYKLAIDSTFEQNIVYCHEQMNQTNTASIKLQDYNNYNFKLCALYQQLIEPLHIPKGNNIIIVPDEKIAYISFDALISEYKEEQVINYAGLPYLLFNYRFSYAYSTNLLFRQNQSQGYSNRVYAFAPDYTSDSHSNSRNTFGELKNAKKEIKSIYKVFKGDPFIGNSATKENFKTSLKNEGIYHLAMHAKPATENPEYSYLAFSSSSDKNQGDYLYNYEIANLPMKASLLVLSACNTGDGEIYSGEGVMSLSRSFLLAGIQSVVHGLWKINDESSSIIMECFYKYLSEGKSKSEALQLAKIDYINNTSPELAQPRYWAGLVLMGDNTPVLKKNKYIFFLSGFSFVLILLIGIYFKKKYFLSKKTDLQKR